MDVIDNIGNKYNIYSSSSEEINLPIKQSDFINRKKEINDTNENNLKRSDKEPEQYINSDSLKLILKNNDIKENKRYPESEDILYDNDYLEEKGKNKNI